MDRHRLPLVTLAACALLFAACSDDDAPADAAPADIAPADVAAPDGAADVAAPDGATPDSAPDGATPDGAPDGAADGAPDVMPTDSGPDTRLCSAGSCPPGTFCRYPAGCGGTGICALIPPDCPPQVAPVCGCDDKTYLSACRASMASVSVKGLGACSTAPCNMMAPCGSDELCWKETGHCVESGVCIPKPDPVACGSTISFSCGCDKQTYTNPCKAAAAGTTLSYSAPCAPPKCSWGMECPTIAWSCLKKNVGDCYGIGTCTTRPTSCSGVGVPVCGCNGTTYSSVCEAEKAGTNIAKLGPC